MPTSITVNWISGGNRVGPNGNGFTFTQGENEDPDDFWARAKEETELLQQQYPPD